MINRIKQTLAKFRDRDEGSMAVETVLIMPLLLWWFAGSFIFYDAFRSHNIAVKTTYTLGDILSRQTTVDNDYIDGMAMVTDFLTRTTDQMYIRVSAIEYSGTDYTVTWSYATNQNDALTTSTIQTNNVDDNYLPIMTAGESVILAETYIPYEPAFNAGFNAKTWFNFVVVRPRFTSQLVNTDYN